MEKAIANTVYDKLAESYNEKIDTKPHNAHYDRPAVQSLVPDVENKTVLDAGCGTGVYLEWLIKKGAKAYVFDASDKMLEFAKRRVGDKAVLYKGCFEDEFTFLENNFFDGIISALAITYVEDLESLFTKFNKVLKNGSWFVFLLSIHFLNIHVLMLIIILTRKKLKQHGVDSTKKSLCQAIIIH